VSVSAFAFFKALRTERVVQMPSDRWKFFLEDQACMKEEHVLELAKDEFQGLVAAVRIGPPLSFQLLGEFKTLRRHALEAVFKFHALRS
jgi:hypothetical protein